MGTQVATVAQQSNVKTVSYVPLGGKLQVELSVEVVRKFLCTPTKNGNQPTDADVIKFIKLCQARELDPWVGDAFLVGYDSKNGPVFNLITAQQALLKRAEINPDYDGMQSGVLVQVDGVVSPREGDFISDNERLVGGWARVFRKNLGTPSYDAVKLSTYNTGLSRWEKDPAGMIVKVAESSALRKAFPTQLGGLYTREEMDAISSERLAGRGPVDQTKKITSLEALADHMTASGPALITSDQPKRASVVETPKSANPYTAEFADCKTLDQVLERHALLMSGPDAETDGAQIEAAAQARRAQIGGGK